MAYMRSVVGVGWHVDGIPCTYPSFPGGRLSPRGVFDACLLQAEIARPATFVLVLLCSSPCLR